VVLLEELVLEQLFYPDSKRARGFRIYSTLFDVLPAILFLVGYKVSWDAVLRQNKIETLNRMIAESELQFLNSQINPHFLFNNLNSLYAYALDRSPKTPEIILQLSSILRYMLYDCKEDTVRLEKEIANLKDYIRLSELQLGDQGKVAFNVVGNPGDLRIAPLILLVFFENAFKHGTASQTENIQINVALNIKADKLYFSCENNYTASSNLDNLSKGIGLKNVLERLDLIYPEKHTINFDSKEDWYRVYLEIKLGDD